MIMDLGLWTCFVHVARSLYVHVFPPPCALAWKLYALSSSGILSSVDLGTSQNKLSLRRYDYVQ